MKSSLSAPRRPKSSPSLVLVHDAERKRTRLEIRGWPVALAIALAGVVWSIAGHWK